MHCLRAFALSQVLIVGLAPLGHAQQMPPAQGSASVPRVVRLDGQFVPANGQPPAAVEVVALALYSSEGDTTPSWEETQEIRVDAQGRYTVFAGASSADGIPARALASAGPQWLGMRFVRPGEVEQPRVPLTSVPYALRASDADTLGGLPPSAFLRAAGAARPAAGAGDDPATTAGLRDPVPSINTGTANFIGRFTDAIDLTSSVLYQSGARIGLGTISPVDFLHTRFTDTTGAVTGIAVQNLGSSATSYSGMLFYDHTGALRQFQGYNNSTGEYRINNISPTGSVNFMIGSTSRFQVRNDGDISISGALRRNGVNILQANVGGGDNNLLLGSFGPALAGLTSVDNTALGTYSLQSLTTGGGNTGVGSGTLRSVVDNIFNVAVGTYAMQNSTGGQNIAIGATSAMLKVTGDNNIYLGVGVANSAANIESSTIRIGDSGLYNRFFAGGVRGVTTGVANAVAVVIDGNGQLGTINSSRRYKEDIQDMGDASSGLMKLRPVTYRYALAFANGAKPIDYGLIAEEVEAVYPDLVAHLAGGEVETVQYHKINAMLLNEVQKQHRQIAEQQAVMDAQQRALDELTARLGRLERQVAPSRR